MNFFIALGKNKIFIITILTWAIAQFIKVIIGIIREKKFNFKWFVGTGGMPSSHCAGVTALATSVGMRFGYDTSIFAVSLILTIITIFDARGVRRSTGRQAEILNKMFEDFYFKKPIREDRLIELIGHTPIQVFAGVALGIICAYILYNIL
ncbi:MAG: divergent PAP2 family protein [Candidatus Omnitrophota bacterium]|nr:MAG: divergent PAP2 family protein [Candidatus Omnitrophota bacterium]